MLKTLVNLFDGTQTRCGWFADQVRKIYLYDQLHNLNVEGSVVHNQNLTMLLCSSLLFARLCDVLNDLASLILKQSGNWLIPLSMNSTFHSSSTDRRSFMRDIFHRCWSSVDKAQISIQFLSFWIRLRLRNLLRLDGSPQQVDSTTEGASRIFVLGAWLHLLFFGFLLNTLEK